MSTKKLLWIPAIAGLVLTILPSIMTFYGALSFETNKWLMTVGTLLWLGAAPFLLGKTAEEL